MSLVVELYPVPWKILDLVKARILKNRAKKAKKGLDWSKETLRREMALTPAPLISRRRDEPSFVPSEPRLYTIEGNRVWTDSGNTKTIRDTWRIYVESDTKEKQLYKTLLWSRSLQPGETFESEGKVPRSAVYLSTFSDSETGAEAPPLIALLGYGISILGDDAGDLLNATATVYAYRPSVPVSADVALVSLIELSDSILSSEYNPLAEWIYLQPLIDAIPVFIGRGGLGWGVTYSNPLTNEYDLTRISGAPGYVGTASVVFTQEANQAITATVEG